MNYTVDPETGCWNYGGYINPQGYGIVATGGTFQKAHRASWEQRHDVKLVPDLTIHHKCRNRACVNPDHLEALPAADHGREHREDSAVLTREQALEIRRRAEAGESQTLIAEMFGVDRRVIGDLTRGRTWMDLGGPIDVPPRACEHCGTVFKPKRVFAKYCHHNCSQAAFQKRKRANQRNERSN